jgi:folate-binding protein YgfZ
VLKPPQNGPTATALDDLGVIRAQGADAVRFLQGQLSSDVTKLAATGSMLAGLHNPRGRVIALLRLVSLGPDDILAVLPRELAAAVVARLSKYVLRAKVAIEDESAQWRVTGLVSPTPPVALAAPIEPTSMRWWVVEPAGEPAMLANRAPLDRESWRALDIAAEIPQIYAATSEAFVAQMINLDALGGIAFDKGCYTGQEVIARAHYRGRVKRRMQRFQLAQSPPRPGDSGTLPDGRSYKVVDAVATPGGCDVLAVASLVPGADESEHD